MAEATYTLCALTSLACAILLARGWRQRRDRLLLWSTGCFSALFVNNCVLIVDKVFVPEIDLFPLRTAIALVGVAALLVGLIWETT